jgi:tRNA (cmo5U34)-methyltransferase
MAERAFDFESDFGARYDRLVRTTIFGYESLFRMVLALVQTRLSVTARVLIVGSGTGAELITFGNLMPGWKLTGVDPSAQMIGLCQQKLNQEALSDRVQLHCGYAADLPAEQQYDAATLVLVMHFIPDDGAKLALLRSIADRLRPGASFVLIDHHGDPQSAEFRHLLSAWQNYQVLMGMPAAAAESLLAEAVRTHHFITEARTRELLAEAGFGNTERFFTAFLTAGWLAQRNEK